MAYYYAPPASLPPHQQFWTPMVVSQFPQVAPQVHPDMEALHQSMMTFCQTATTALAEQQRLAAEMRETLAKILELSAGPETVPEAVPETVPEVPELGEVGGCDHIAVDRHHRYLESLQPSQEQVRLVMNPS